MKLFERLDFSKFVPEVGTTISKNRVVMGLLAVLNIAAYLRALYTKSWKSFLVMNVVVMLCLVVYLLYRV
jgi:hypothetical protein